MQNNTLRRSKKMSFRRSISSRSDVRPERANSISSQLSFVPERYFTAGEALPVAISIEKLDLGGIKFESRKNDSPEDLQLLYDINTRELSIQSRKPSTIGHGRPGIHKINSIQAATLELINPLPGYLESVLVRMVLELNTDVIYEPITEGNIVSSIPSKPIPTRRVIIHASVHECGHLRDILLFMKSDTPLSDLSIDDDNPYVSPSRSSSIDADTDKPLLTRLSTLPVWSIYIPWWLYSGRVRKVLQLSLLLYTVFTIVWASWQLYRHVNVIQLALEPVVQFFKFYLNDVMKSIDLFLAWFTELSTTFLRPIHIFTGLFLVPVVNLLLAFKNVLAPFTAPILAVMGQFSHCLAPFSNCLSGVWQSLASSRVALQNIDLTQQVAKTLVINSFKAIFYGLLRLVGYKRAKDKEKEVINAKPGDPHTPISSPIKRKYAGTPNASIPVYYISSVTKKSTTKT